MRRLFLTVVAVLLFCRFSDVFAEESQRFAVRSPDESICAELSFTDAPVLRVLRGEVEVVAPSRIALTVDPAFDGGLTLVDSATSERNEVWTPTWGENATIRNAYRGFVATLRESGALARELQFELRVFDAGVAFRYVLPKGGGVWRGVGEDVALAFSPDCDAWPLYSTEATYPKDALKLRDVDKTVFAPLTLRLPEGIFASILEASDVAYPRTYLRANGEGKVGVQLGGTATLNAENDSASTAWRVVMIAPNEAKLVEQEDFLLNLTSPSKISDVSWIRPGKTISNEANCDIKTDQLISMVDFAAACNMKYVQIDWGWYGTEWRWNKDEQDVWAKTNPEKASDPDWRRNCEANPYRVAKGLAPYLPTWKSMTYVDLDLPKLIQYGKEKGVGICLYVNDRMLKSNDLESLFTEYERWGLAGLKPGFVRYGSQESEESIQEMIRIAARHKLWLCVHDEYLPDGFSRPYPNLMSVEGGGGQEGGHPDWHDVTLPFGRGLAGPFDYTPMLYVEGKSAAHQLSLLTTIYNPAPVIRGGWAIRENRAEGGFGNAFGDELEFLRKLDTDWIQTRVLDAKIGRYVVTTRETREHNWQLGATNGSEAVSRRVALDFLTPGVRYRATIWRDSDEERDGWRPTIREERIVRSDDALELTLQPSGGAVAIFERVEE